MTNERNGRYRVVHVGTGLTGREALRAIIEDPALDLVGVKVSTQEKVGVDAGQLYGGAHTGVAATDDVAAVLALKPDCVAYCATAVRREEEAIADIAGYLEAGINVVTISTIPMVYPAAAPVEWREALERAAVKGNSTFYATGSEPGFISLNIPTALLAGAGRVDSYRMDEYALDLDKTYPIWDVLHESMGFGKPDGHVPVRIASGKVDEDWGTVVRYLADILGFELDGIELDWETPLAPTDLPTAIGVIPQGTICAHRWQLAGIVGGQPAVAVQYFATVSATPWPKRWPKPAREGEGGMVFRVNGSPSMSLELHLDQSATDRVNPGVSATAMAAVNAIPTVVEASPGVIASPLAGPSVVTRRSGG
ncbi:NAD(P)H-dependent amine dehydrogenase family protein [Mycobacterium deserti]|uniref:Dihydrodipicolinate reductase n=1 Tax=Mycobacterium deserti TaxID=2978347 RepID=A0ABT2MG27_9MYCO|nr:dihydrodipicolinate reductase [Mycobacterium deserti]MCT7661177.1 dihydrodipicolinate reductase [Mycobacterium deserti]